jgi:hypothetical protein
MEIRLLEVEEAPATSLPAQASSLARSCEHVPIDGRVNALGYRFFPMPGSELPSFFVKRFCAGDRGGAITLLAGMDPATGEAVLEDCRSAAEAARRLARGEAGLWLVQLSYGARRISMDDLRGAFGARHPQAAAAFTSQLSALVPLERDRCPICRPAAG